MINFYSIFSNKSRFTYGVEFLDIALTYKSMKNSKYRSRDILSEFTRVIRPELDYRDPKICFLQYNGTNDGNDKSS